MATDFVNNYYIPKEVKGYNSQHYAYTINQPDAPSLSIQNAKCLNDIPHKFIKQINLNEFLIKYKKNIWAICLFILVSGYYYLNLRVFAFYCLNNGQLVP